MYSQKVEYLHKLVFKCLEVVSERKDSAVEIDVEGGEGAVADPDIVFPEDPDFLPLDDIPEAKGIDLNERQDLLLRRTSSGSGSNSLLLSGRYNSRDEGDFMV